MRLTAALVGSVALALLVGGVRSADGANSASFTDPAGDGEGGLSPDITGVSIANDDSGLVTVTIQLASSRPLGAGMRTGVLFDTDANAGTGDPDHVGAEYAMQLDVSANTWAYYRWNGSALERVTSTTGKITFTSQSTTVTINSSELAGTSRMNFYVFGDYVSNGTYYTDWAPARGGTWQYNIVIAATTTTTPPPATTTAPPPATTTNPPPATTNQAGPASVVDSDRDGVVDKSDACPTTRGGPYDKNKNGCPGPFPAIKRPTAAALRATFSVLGRSTYEPPENVIGGLPPGARVFLQYKSDREQLRAGKSRSVKSKLLLRHKFPNRAAIEIRAWKPGWIGYSVRLILFTDKPWAKIANPKCIPPTGSTAPRPCSRVPPGR